MKPIRYNALPPQSSQEARFDDALPTALKRAAQPAAQSVHIHKEHKTSVVSPYIIHLSSQDPAMFKAESTSLDALEAHIKAQQDLLLEDGELTETEDDLVIDFSDLADQLSEPDRPAAATYPSAAPSSDFSRTAPTAPADTFIPVSLPTPIQTPAPQPTVEIEQVTVTPTRVTATRYRVWSLPKSHRTRALAGVTALSLALLIPLQALTGLADISNAQGSVISAGEAGLDQILRGSQSLQAQNFDLAQSNFSQASAQFAGAQDELETMNLLVAGLLKIVPETDRAKTSAKQLLVAGEQFAYAGESLAQAASDIESSSPNLSLKLSILSTHLESALPHMEAGAAALAKVDLNSIPQEKQADITQLQAQAPELLASMQEFIRFSETLQTILGEEQSMRYLLTFQNTAEVRATGGFMGSFAEIDMKQGAIDRIYVPGGGTYAVQGQLQEHIAAPEPLTIINPRWEMQDANWSPDFADSAQKLAWFYENAGGPTVDGVIAINSTVLPELLAVVGPITLEERGLTITAENVLFELQKTKTEDIEAPKALIGDLAPALLETIATLPMEDLLLVADLLGTSLSQKDIQLYFKNNSLQSDMLRLGWAGQQKQTLSDYLMVVNSNIGGGKTDTIIDQTVKVDVAIQPSGEVINTVTITKTHKGIASRQLDGFHNVDYLRAYVPKGSVLLGADGFEVPPAAAFQKSPTPLAQDEDLLLSMSGETKDPVSQTDIWQENGKTVFGNWVQTAPGETQTVSFTYLLPFNVLEAQQQDDDLLTLAKSKLGFKELHNYSFLLQKQSGVESRTTTVNITVPESLKTLWSSHDLASNEWNNDTDHLITSIFERTGL